MSRRVVISARIVESHMSDRELEEEIRLCSFIPCAAEIEKVTVLDVEERCAEWAWPLRVLGDLE